MQTKIVPIGNSSGVRIPKALLEAAQLSVNQAIELKVVDCTIVIQPASQPREGWEASFAGPPSEDLWEDLPLAEGWPDTLSGGHARARSTGSISIRPSGGKSRNSSRD